MLPQRIILSPDVLFQEINGEGIILDLTSSGYFGLDGVGVQLWQMLQMDSSVPAAFQALLEKYDVEPVQLEQDIARLIAELVDAGLVSTA